MTRSALTLVSLFLDRVAADGDRPALGTYRNGEYRWETWDELARDVVRTAAALVSLGVQPGDRVVQVSENRREWIVVDLAILLARAIHVPIHAPLAGPQIVDQICDCDPRVVIVSGPEQAAKLAPLIDSLPSGVRMVSHDPCGAADLRSLHISPLVSQAVVTEPTISSAMHDIRSLVTPADIATIIYTSGTTGEPKGVMLTHDNLVTNTHGTIEAFPCAPDDVRLTLLPLSHIFARTCDLYTWIAVGSRLALARSRESVLEDCQLVQPTMINAVPYFFDRVARTLREEGRADDPAALASKLGGRIHTCCSGGAALPDHVAEFYLSRGVFLAQGFGLTETSPVITLSPPEANKIGFVGRPIRDVEIRVAADGEVLTRGPHVMRGYWNKPGATSEVLRDGWFHTGDLGEIDAEGYLKITGRKKELIVTAAGKNIAPVFLESLLAEDPLVHQVLIIGDGRSYLTALIVPSPDALRREIVARGIPVASAAEALAHPQVQALYDEAIRRRLAGVSHHEQVRKFTLLDRAFSIEAGELTPTLKLRREVIASRWREVIDGMYRDR